jgi:hypothetical protein
MFYWNNIITFKSADSCVLCLFIIEQIFRQAKIGFYIDEIISVYEQISAVQDLYQKMLSTNWVRMLGDHF